MSGTKTGRVVRIDAKVCHVDIDGTPYPCALRGTLFEHLLQKNPIAVGDLVDVDLASTPPTIDSVQARRNWLGRTASTHDPREQVLVANVDRLFVVASLGRPGFSSNRTDRILAASVWHDIPPTLVINKIDLAREGELEALRETYAGAGAEIIETCAVTGQGVELLRAALTGKVSALYGASGAGKSSLLNAIQPGFKLKIGKVSRFWEAGRHTTSFSQLLRLDGLGGYVVDTPGIRVFRMHALTKGDLRSLFPEIERLQSRCRFPDCTHDHEPECAVFDAVEAGEVPPTRYASYVEMMDELSKPEDEGEDEEDPPEEE